MPRAARRRRAVVFPCAQRLTGRALLPLLLPLPLLLLWLVRSGGSRQRVLLSCSHVYHEPCLHAFESFKLGDGPSCCPVCRQAYEKRVWREAADPVAPPPPPARDAMEDYEARIASLEAEMFLEGTVD